MNNRAERSRQLRYRKAALGIIQRERLDDELYSIASECAELEWSVEDDETLLDVFDGDRDEIHEFRFMFSDLSNKCEQLQDVIRDEYVTEHFDDFLSVRSEMPTAWWDMIPLRRIISASQDMKPSWLKVFPAKG